MAKTKAPGDTTPLLLDRVIDFRRIAVRELKPHAQNWRVHPQYQRDMLKATLQQIGIADALIVYDSASHGGLTILDGHLRAEDHPQAWPCLVTDLTDEEADLLLMTHDPLAALAQTHQETYQGLLESVQVADEGLQRFLASLVAEENQAAAVASPEEFPSYDETIPTAYCCPKCGYEWSGKPA